VSIWIEMLPNGWEEAPLKTRLVRNDGGVWGADPDGDDDRVVLRSTEQRVDGSWAIEEPAYRKLTGGEVAGSLLENGDLVVTKSSGSERHIGKTSLVTPEVAALNACYSNFMQRLRVDDRTEPRFVHYWLNNSICREQFAFLSNSTSGLANLNSGLIGSAWLAFPSYQEQQRIANFLDTQMARIDALIAEKEQLLQSLSEYSYSYASSIMARGLNPGAEMVKTSFPELGSIPRHWSVKRLKVLGEVRSGVAKGKDLGERDTISLPYLRVANVQDGYVDLSEVLEIEVAKSEATRYLLHSGDVLMNEGGDNDKLGRGTVWEGQIDPCIHQNHVFAVRLLDPSLAEWVARFTSTDAARSYFFLRSKQSTNLASINQSNVRELPVPMPPDEERLAILEELRRSSNATSELYGHAQAHIERLREYRSSLISAAVTGQLDICVSKEAK
jgi:type I restriction enzyme, S subunit